MRKLPEQLLFLATRRCHLLALHTLGSIHHPHQAHLAPNAIIKYQTSSCQNSLYSVHGDVQENNAKNSKAKD